MMFLLAGIPLETHARLLQQFGGHGQINLRVCQTGMPKVNGEMIYQPLHVSPLAVPHLSGDGPRRYAEDHEVEVGGDRRPSAACRHAPAVARRHPAHSSGEGLSRVD